MITSCAVYEVPSSSLDPDPEGEGGSAGTSAGSTPAIAGKSSGGTAAGGQLMAGSSNGGSGSSSSSAGDGGGHPLEVPAGGEGGAVQEPDLCPDDPDKLAPGACGCGLPDESTTTLADCRDIEAALVHHYDFEGTGTAVMDRVGSAHGTIVGGAVLSKRDGRGVVELGGGSAGPYVDLPNGIISKLTDASFEAWLIWRGGNDWQRVLDFGDSTHSTPENNPVNGKTYLFVTPQSGEDVLLSGYSLNGNSAGEELRLLTEAALPQAVLSHVLLVADNTMNKLTLYLDGEARSEETWTGKLSAINDVNVWLGRSQYAGDHELNAIYHDFRIYDAALSELQVATCFAAGPDPAFLAD